MTATAVGESRIFSYKAADGLALKGVLTLPPGREAKSLPLVVMPHGGPEGHDEIRFDWIAQAFAAQGYAVFQPNFRGSDGYAIELRDAGYGEWGRKMQTDISDGVVALAREGIIDPKRACIVGASYGGYASLAGVTVQHGLYRCAVSIAGVSDLNRFMVWSHSRQNADITDVTRFWRKFMGATSDLDPAMKPLSPARLADGADAPILLIHGRNDTIVPLEQSEFMQHALQAAGKPVDLLVLEGDDHQLSLDAQRKAALNAAVNFAMKNNPPDVTPTVAPATAPGSSR